MFATVATTITVGVRASERRGRAVSLLLMSETLGLLLGSTLGGWLYQGFGSTSPLLLEAACMLVAAGVVARALLPAAELVPPGARRSHDRHVLAAVLRTPGVFLTGLTSAVLISLQTGVLVFLFPLYLVNQQHLEPSTVGALVSLTVLGRLAALWFGGVASDRFGRMRILAPGLLAYGVVLGSLTLFTYPLALGIWSAVVGTAAGIVMPLPTALIGDRVPPHLQGIAVGWLRTMTDTGHILGALVMGALADAVDIAAPFFWGAVMLFVVAWLCHRQTAMRPAAP
jgi:MFS family permease